MADPDDPGSGGRRGPNDPDNPTSPNRTTQPVDTRTAPGYQVSDRALGFSRDDYFDWLATERKQPYFAALFAMGGNDAIRTLWRANVSNMDDVALQNSLDAKSWYNPNFTTPGGGGSRGGGGGGGSAGPTPDTVEAVVQAIKENAADQLLNISEATAREWAGQVVNNKMTLEGTQALLQNQARLRYAWADSQLQQGISMRQLVLPARDLIARELEMAPEEVDLMDPKWMSMMQTMDEKGQTRIANDSEIVGRVRKDYQWAFTRNGAAAASRVATLVRDQFGG